jgi:hypothetical protein
LTTSPTRRSSVEHGRSDSSSRTPRCFDWSCSR